ncbi:holin [Clostridium sp. CTA-6]
MSVNDFMKLEQLATFTGCMMVTFMFVQVLKDLKPFKQIPTKYLSIVIGILNVIMVSVMQNKFDVAQLYLMIINGTLVGLTATGTYDFKGEKREDANVATDTKEFDDVIKG